jgi:hypothetical protein
MNEKCCTYIVPVINNHTLNSSWAVIISFNFATLSNYRDIWNCTLQHFVDVTHFFLNFRKWGRTGTGIILETTPKNNSHWAIEPLLFNCGPQYGSTIKLNTYFSFFGQFYSDFWILIQWLWIRIRIRIGNLDPGSRGKKIMKIKW